MTAPIAVVSISGGKDSLATALVAIDSYGRDRVMLVHADTGHEHPLTVDYVSDYLPAALDMPIVTVRADFTERLAGKRKFVAEHWEADGVPAEQVARAIDVLQPTGNPFLDLCLWKGRFPSRRSQFCTEELKGLPLDLHTIELVRSGLTVESWSGVRRDESNVRKNALPRERSDLGWDIVRPIVAWSAAEAIDYATARGIDQNPLYRRGMRRVGCMPCINCSKDELNEIGWRWPPEIGRVAEWERLVSVASKRGASTFFHGSPKDPTESAQEIFARLKVEERVKWSRTSRGGVQFDLERGLPSPECTSSYGLCE